MEFPAEKPKWGILDVILVILVIVGVSFIYGWIRPYVYFTLVYNYGFPDTVTTEFTLDFLVQFLVTLLTIAAVIVWFRRTPLTQLGFNKTSGKLLMLYGVAGGVVVFVIVMLVGAVIQQFAPVSPQDFEKVLREAAGPGETILLIIIGAVVGPFYEELLFRGILYPVFRARIGVRWGIVVSAFLFSLVHFDALRLVPLFLGGVGLAYIYEKSRSIYCCWIAHGTWNLIMALSLFINP